MKLDSFVKLKNQSITIILSVGIKYSVRDLLVTSVTTPDPQSSDRAYASHTVNDVSAPSGINSL